MARPAFCAHQAFDASDSPTIVSPSRPQDSHGEIVYEAQGLKQKDLPIVPGLRVLPQPIKLPSPKYPKSLKKAHAAADVTVEGVITQNGDFIDAKVINEVDSELSKNALDAVARYQFKPATLDGKPIAILTQLVIQFRIR